MRALTFTTSLLLRSVWHERPFDLFFALTVGTVCDLAEEFVALIKEQDIKSCFVLAKDAIKY